MNIFLIIVILVVLTALGFIMTRAKRKKESTESPPEFILQNVEKGGVLTFTGIGENLDDVDVIVKSKNIYREGNSSWFELECAAGGTTYWLEVNDDDELEISLTLKKVSLSDVALTEQDLMRFDDEEAGIFEYAGELYSYKDSGEAEFLREGRELDKQPFYYWDFCNDNESKCISFEKWEDGSIDGSYSERLAQSQISIFALNDKDSDN